MPGVTVDDEVGRFLLRGYQLVRRSDSEALLARPRTRKVGQILLLIVGLVIGASGIFLGINEALSWITWVGVGVVVLSIVLFWLSVRPSSVRVFLDGSGSVQYQTVRGSHW